jgi:predicted Zn-ribbon and HTH transcriptional regulator
MPDTDWSEIGRKADAHRVRDLYRRTFDNRGKNDARPLMVSALVNAGGTRCLDLWGGGLSADALVAAGLSVLSVDNGYELRDALTVERRQESLRRSGEEGGYETAWGAARRYASTCDVAFLDFCGPPSEESLETVRACRHMKAIVVTFTTGHDIHTGAPSQELRERSYRVLLREAFGIGSTIRQPDRSRKRLGGSIMTLCRYRNKDGRLVLVFLLRRSRSIGHAVPLYARQRVDIRWRAQLAARSRRYRETHLEVRAAQNERKKAKDRAERAARLAALPPINCAYCGLEFRASQVNARIRFCSTKCSANAGYHRRKNEAG